MWPFESKVEREAESSAYRKAEALFEIEVQKLRTAWPVGSAVQYLGVEMWVKEHSVLEFARSFQRVPCLALTYLDSSLAQRVVRLSSGEVEALQRVRGKTGGSL